MPNDPAKRKAAQRARERALGLVYVTVRVPEQDADKIKRAAARLVEAFRKNYAPPA